MRESAPRPTTLCDRASAGVRAVGEESPGGGMPDGGRGGEGKGRDGTVLGEGEPGGCGGGLPCPAPAAVGRGQFRPEGRPWQGRRGPGALPGPGVGQDPPGSCFWQDGEKLRAALRGLPGRGCPGSLVKGLAGPWRGHLAIALHPQQDPATGQGHSSMTWPHETCHRLL